VISRYPPASYANRQYRRLDDQQQIAPQEIVPVGRNLALYRGFEYHPRSRTEPPSAGFQEEKVDEVYSEVPRKLGPVRNAGNQLLSRSVRIPPAPPFHCNELI
jgi:hypothetical protein